MNYAVVTNRTWMRNAAVRGDFNDGWTLHWAPDPAFITPSRLTGARYVFFPFWSYKVPKEITDSYECVCFHMTDVPYGRGGSPLQNLILRGHTETVISALRMTDEIDAGPVYMKRPLSLDGTAREIYERAALIIADMMREIAATDPVPVPQSGEVVSFKRRLPSESRLPLDLAPREAYDFIRMLDADDYPKAFVEVGPLRIELTNACLDGDKVTATAVIV